MNHKQVWTKVNTNVDEGIKNLVDALSLFPRLRTLSSCQCLSDNRAMVNFCYGEDSYGAWRDLSEFVLGWFGPRLSERVGDDVALSVRVTTLCSVQADLLIRPGALESVTNEIKNLAQEFRDSYPTP